MNLHEAAKALLNKALSGLNPIQYSTLNLSNDDIEEFAAALSHPDPRDAELAAMREAVRVLGNRVRSCEHLLVCYRLGRRPSDAVLDTARTTADEVDANPIASAALKETPK